MMQIVFNEGTNTEQSYDITICQEIKIFKDNSYILTIKRVFEETETLVPAQTFFSDILSNYNINTISVYKNNNRLMMFDNYHNIRNIYTLFSDLNGQHFDRIISIEFEREG